MDGGSPLVWVINMQIGQMAMSFYDLHLRPGI